MARLRFSQAVDKALAEGMARDDRIVVLGEDVRMLRPGLLASFGPGRVLGAPISEAGFVGAGVGAAMAGLRPVIEVWMVDFITCAMDAVLNHMAKLEAFSGGRWKCPLVIRTPAAAADTVMEASTGRRSGACWAASPGWPWSCRQRPPRPTGS